MAAAPPDPQTQDYTLPPRRGPNLLASKGGRRAAFFLLYVSEGIPFGFASTAIATEMRQRGVSVAAIGVFVAWLYLPWAWKWAAGPVVDLVSSDRLGRRRAWIVACQAAMAGTLLLAWPIDFATRIGLFTWIILVHNAFAAVQDVAIDALAVDTLPEPERGVASGLMFAGQYLGTAVGGAGVLYLSSRIGFATTFPLVAGAIVVILLAVTAWLREPMRALPVEEAGGAEDRAARIAREVGGYVTTALRSIFGNRASFAGVLFALLPPGAFGLTHVARTSLAVDLGMSNDQVANLTLAATVAAAAGCVIGGALSDRLGRRLSLAAYILLTTAPPLVIALLLLQYGWGGPVGGAATAGATPAPAILLNAFWIACCAGSFVLGLIYGARTALFMDLSNPAVAATQFTAYMALMNVVLSYTAWWQGYAIERLGYPTTFFIDAGLGLLCLGLLPFMSPRRPRGAGLEARAAETVELGATPANTEPV